MKPSSTPDTRATSGRGSRLLTDWVLECLAAHGSRVEARPDASYDVETGAEARRILGVKHLQLLPAKAESGPDPASQPLAWDSPAIQALLAHARDRGAAAELFQAGVGAAEGLRIIEARLEIEGAKPKLEAVGEELRPLLTYNFKVRWQGSEGREELRSLCYDPSPATAREIPPSDQYDFVPPPAKRPHAHPALPVREGFDAARAVLEASLEEKLTQRQRRDRASRKDEEGRLNAYYSQLLRDEQHGSPRRGERRARERADQLKREWRQKLEALAAGGEEASYGLISAAVLWVPWLRATVTLPGRPKLSRPTEVDLHLKRWEGLTCDACGGLHTFLRREGPHLKGAACDGPGRP